MHYALMKCCCVLEVLCLFAWLCLEKILKHFAWEMLMTDLMTWQQCYLYIIGEIVKLQFCMCVCEIRQHLFICKIEYTHAHIQRHARTHAHAHTHTHTHTDSYTHPVSVFSFLHFKSISLNHGIQSPGYAQVVSLGLSSISDLVCWGMHHSCWSPCKKLLLCKSVMKPCTCSECQWWITVQSKLKHYCHYISTKAS